MGFLLFISKACQALSASACRASPPLHQETSPCGDPNTPDYETLGKKQSGCDLSTEPITEVLNFSIHCSTRGQITLKTDTSLTLRFYRRLFNRNIMENHATRSSTLALSCQTCFGNDGCRSRLRNPWGIAWRPGRTEEVGGEFFASAHRAGCGSCFEGQMS